MGMFCVNAGTKVKVVRINDDWEYEMKDHVTKKVNVFEKHELVIDPTGIAKWACTPKDVKTVGGKWAKRGWYGFQRDEWYMLVPKDQVYYG